MIAIELNEKQIQCLRYIKKTIEAQGTPPTIRDIELHIGYRSPCPVQNLLDQLKEIGCVSWQPNRARTLRLLPLGLSLIGNTLEDVEHQKTLISSEMHAIKIEEWGIFYPLLMMVQLINGQDLDFEEASRKREKVAEFCRAVLNYPIAIKWHKQANHWIGEIVESP